MDIASVADRFRCLIRTVGRDALASVAVHPAEMAVVITMVSSFQGSSAATTPSIELWASKIGTTAAAEGLLRNGALLAAVTAAIGELEVRP